MAQPYPSLDDLSGVPYLQAFEEAAGSGAAALPKQLLLDFLLPESQPDFASRHDHYWAFLTSRTRHGR